jgi:hypothetical protein
MRGLLALGVLAMIVPIATLVLAAMLAAKLPALAITLQAGALGAARPGLTESRLATFVVATMLTAKLLPLPVILMWPAQPALEG